MTKGKSFHGIEDCHGAPLELIGRGTYACPVCGRVQMTEEIIRERRLRGLPCPGDPKPQRGN